MCEKLLYILQYNQLFFQHRRVIVNTKSIIPTTQTSPNPFPSEVVAFCTSPNSSPNHFESEALRSRIKTFLLESATLRLQIETLLLESETLLLQSATLRLQIETLLSELKKLRSRFNGCDRKAVLRNCSLKYFYWSLKSGDLVGFR